MGTTSTHVNLPGSDRKVFRNARRGKPIEPHTRFEVTVRVRRPPIPAERIRPPKNAPHLTHQELERQHGAKDTDLAAVVAFAARYGLVVVEQRKASGSVVLSGFAAQFEKAFDVELHHYEHDHGTYRGRVGFVRIPADLDGIIVGVFGLDNRPFARPHNLRAKPSRAAEATTFNPQDLAALYDFPTGVSGSGQTIGIVELGGGYRPTDLKTYFKNLGVTVTGTLTAISVDNGTNQPGGDADDEVMLDIEVASAVAPGANIAVYFTPDTTDKSFLDAVDNAVHDQVNAPSVVSISWGGPETGTTDSFSTQMDETMQAAAALGITVCVASGDNGAADEGPSEWDGLAHADSPASSPHVLAVGGTRILARAASGKTSKCGIRIPPIPKTIRSGRRGAVSARRSRCPRGRRTSRCRRPPIPARAPVEASPTSRPMPIPPPDTTSASAGRTSPSVAPAQPPRSGPRSSRSSINRRDVASASSTRPCTRTPVARPSTPSPAATTRWEARTWATRPDHRGTPALAWVRPTGKRRRRSCSESTHSN
jgi:kumamolisin